MLEFLGLPDESGENDLEDALIRHLERFLLELPNKVLAAEYRMTLPKERVIAEEIERMGRRSPVRVVLEASMFEPSGLHWRRVSLRELCLKTELVDPTKHPEIPFRYVDVSSVSNTSWSITGTTPHNGRTAPSRARKLIRAGDVIYATVRPTLKRVAVVPNDLDGAVASTAFLRVPIRPIQSRPRFLFFVLLGDAFSAQLGLAQRGASYPAVTDGDVLGQPIDVPRCRSSVEALGRVVVAGADVPGRTWRLPLVRQGNHWKPTFQRGTPEELAEPLANRLQHLWLVAVTMADFSESDEP